MTGQPEFESLLGQLVPAALAAGLEARRIQAGTLAVELKADQSPVTAADRAAEALILARLAELAPGVPVIAEEQVAAGPAPARPPDAARTFFLVDPLDGTKEFVQRRGDYTVNIALIAQGAPVLGVVYAPVSDVLYLGDCRRGLAQRVTGAARGGSPVAIRVRTAPVAGLTAAVSRSHPTPATEAYLAHVNVAERVEVGSSLKFCLVAAGEADIYPRLGPTMEWDTAAGQAVLVAAGGRVLDQRGRALAYGKPGFRNGSFVAAGAGVEVPPIESVA